MKYDVQNIETKFSSVDALVSKSYLSNLSSYPVVKIKKDPSYNVNNFVCFWNITQIVLNKNEDMRDKLVSVFNAVGSSGASLLFLIKGEKDGTTIRVGIRNDSNNSNEMVRSQNVLEKSLSGNFPGIKYSFLKRSDLESEISASFSSEVLDKTITAVTDIAGVRSENSKNNKTFMQGIEKIIDSMQGQEYTALLIADPISNEDLLIGRRALENIYSSLVPFSGSMQTVSRSDAETVGHSVSESASESIGYGISDMITHTTGKSFSKTEGTSTSKTKGTFSSDTLA